MRQTVPCTSGSNRKCLTSISEKASFCDKEILVTRWSRLQNAANRNNDYCKKATKTHRNFTFDSCRLGCVTGIFTVFNIPTASAFICWLFPTSACAQSNNTAEPRPDSDIGRTNQMLQHAIKQAEQQSVVLFKHFMLITEHINTSLLHYAYRYRCDNKASSSKTIWPPAHGRSTGAYWWCNQLVNASKVVPMAS